jgi:heavy metal sensor kinase
MNSIVDRELETRLAGIVDHLERHLDKVPWSEMGQVLDAHPAFQPSFLAIRGTSGNILFEGHFMAGVALPGTSKSTNANGAGDTLRLLSARREIRGQPYDLILATDLQMAVSILRHLWLVMLLSMPPLLSVCAGAGYWMSGRALSPIQRIVAAARSIDSSRLNRRVPVPCTKDEIQQLGETFNGMLERIESGFRQMRDFTANASHELRTPVALVRAAAEIALLRPRPSGAFYRETLERILRESERNSLLLESMLELSRADSRLDALERDALSLNQSLAEAVEQVTPLAAPRQIALRFEPDGAPREILADREQLRRLWLILLDNAIKYTPAGGSVLVRAGSNAAGQAMGEIIDSGAGIAPEHQELIFERFYRTDKARSRSMGGAGLGLAIAREIAIVHEAKLQVESQPGNGSRFYVTFPHARARLFRTPASAEPQTLR